MRTPKPAPAAPCQTCLHPFPVHAKSGREWCRAPRCLCAGYDRPWSAAAMSRRITEALATPQRTVSLSEATLRELLRAARSTLDQQSAG